MMKIMDSVRHGRKGILKRQAPRLGCGERGEGGEQEQRKSQQQKQKRTHRQEISSIMRKKGQGLHNL
jgi:hypothetical protein